MKLMNLVSVRSHQVMALCLFVLPCTLSAHHSVTAFYDPSVISEVEGTVAYNA